MRTSNLTLITVFSTGPILVPNSSQVNPVRTIFYSVKVISLTTYYPLQQKAAEYNFRAGNA
jgi:hypothetical protein